MVSSPNRAGRRTLAALGQFVAPAVVLGLLWAMARPAVAATPAPMAPNAAIQQAANFLEWGRFKDARSLLATALAQPGNADNAALLAYYGHVLMKFGDVNEGLKVTKRAVALDPNCASCHLYLFEAMAEHAKTINHFRALLELPKLKKQLETAGSLNPNLGDVQWGWIELDLTLPKAVGGGVQDAQAHADRLIQLDPVDGHLARAQIAEAQDQPAVALAEYQAAAQSHPDDPRGVFALGRALFQQGHHQQAATYFDRAVHLNDESALYTAYRSANLIYLHHLEQARTALDAWQQAHPDSRLGEYLVAQALKDIGQDFTWAKQLLGSYLDVPTEPDQPTDAQARHLLASLQAG